MLLTFARRLPWFVLLLAASVATAQDVVIRIATRPDVTVPVFWMPREHAGAVSACGVHGKCGESATARIDMASSRIRQMPWESSR